MEYLAGLLVNMKQSGIYLNLETIARLDVRKVGFDKAYALIGDELDVVKSPQSLNRMLCESFTKQQLTWIKNDDGEFVLDVPHLSLLEASVDDGDPELLSLVSALKYYFSGEILSESMALLSQRIRSKKHSYIYPKYTWRDNGLVWDSCPQIFNTYMVYLSAPKRERIEGVSASGGNSFWLDFSDLAKVAYYMLADNNDFTVACDRAKKSLLFGLDSPKIERVVLDSFFKNEFFHMRRLPEYSVLRTLMNQAMSKFEHGVTRTCYSLLLQPLMLEIIDAALSEIVNTLSRHYNTYGLQDYIYFVSDRAIGVHLPDDTNPKALFPAFIDRIRDVDADNIIDDLLDGLLS